MGKEQEEENVEEKEDRETITKRPMGSKRKAVTSYCQLRGGKGIGKWWENKIGRTLDAVYVPRCREEEETPDHIVFQCVGIKRLKDIRGRREWVEENELGLRMAAERRIFFFFYINNLRIRTSSVIFFFSFNTRM